jgi:phosphohistidine phosphatase
MIRGMKRLYLLRHAKSSWDEPGLADRDRPLAPRGRRASKAVGGHLREERVAPDIVLCSPSQRTRETLDRIGLAEGSEVRIEDEIYGASPGDLLGLLHRVPVDAGSAMLIGHNPSIQELALTISGGGENLDRVRAKFPTAALATLEFEGAWAELAPRGAELVAFVRPKDLSGNA